MRRQAHQGIALSLFAVVLCWVCVSDGEAKPRKTHDFSSHPPQLHLVFCPLHYPEVGEFHGDVTELMETLERTVPFNEVPAFVTWEALEPVRDEDAVFTPVVGSVPPLVVQTAWRARLDATQHGPYKLVILDAVGAMSCAELSFLSQRSLMMLGKRRYHGTRGLARGFLHELGHSLGLRDECVQCAPQTATAGPPNCARDQHEAQQWWGDLVGTTDRVLYVNGCVGNLAYVRPTIASLMNNPDEAGDYGPVNERYLRTVLSHAQARQAP